MDGFHPSKKVVALLACGRRQCILSRGNFLDDVIVMIAQLGRNTRTDCQKIGRKQDARLKLFQTELLR